MTGKFKITMSVISAVAVLSLCSCSKQDAPAASTTGVWQTTPEAVDFSTEAETTYASYEEPFSKAYSVKNKQLETDELTLDGAYFRTDGNSLAIESYKNSDGKFSFYVCTFKDGKTYRLTIDSGIRNFSVSDNLFIDKNSDLLVLRYHIDEETIRQIIYDFSDDEFIAVRDRNYGYDDPESMEAAITEYNADAGNLIRYSDVAVTDDVTGYVESNLTTKAE